jgi:hypothetical protein
MKTLCSALVVIMAWQSLCGGVCFGAYVHVIRHGDMPMTSAPHCHGGTVPISGNRSHRETDPCVERLALESRSRTLNLIPLPILLQEGVLVVHQDPILAWVSKAVGRSSEASPPPSQRPVLRI